MPHALLAGSPEARAAAMAALARRAAPPGADELDALRDCLADPRKLVQRRAAEAFAALAERGVAVVEPLRAALAAPEVRLRWGAVYALSLIGPIPLAALPTLLEVLGLGDGDLRWAAAELLKRLATSEPASVVGRLLAAAAEPGTPRKMALYCLRDLAVADAFHVALAALADADIETRLAALAVLAKVYPDRTVAALRIAALVSDVDPRMQRAAAGTLGSLGIRSADVFGALQQAEASGDPSLRRAAAHSRRLLG